MPVFKILAINMAHLDEAIQKLNRKAKKLKCQEIVTKVLGYSPAIVDKDGFRKQRAFYEVEVTGESPVIPGWTFMGTIEHTKVGNILRSVPGNQIPETYREAKPTCDHCKTSRQRNDTYVVKSEAGEIKQVGHNCVRDYLGNVSPERLAFAAQWASEFERLGSEEYSGSRGPSGAELRDFLQVTAELAIKEGFRSSKDERGSTAKAAFNNIMNRKTLAINGFKHQIIIPSQPAIELAEAALEWLKQIDEFSSYFLNMKVAIQKPVVTYRDAGLVGSVIQAYSKAMDLIEKKSKEPKPVSEYQGEIGKRYDYKLQLKKKIMIQPDYRDAYFVLILVDEKGNVYKWVDRKSVV